MLYLSEAQVMQWLSQVIWPFFRISALLMSMAVFSNRWLPARIRLVIALVLTAVVAPHVDLIPTVELFSFKAVLIICAELITGVALGFITKLMIETFSMAGQMIAMQSGLGFASMVDPANGGSIPIISQWYVMLTSLLFVTLDGHLLFIEATVLSFDSFPIGEILTTLNAQLVFELGRWLFAGALVIAIAAVLSLLLVNLAFGIMMRAAPQINIFSVGFPLTMIAGLILFWFVSQYSSFQFASLLEEGAAVACLITRLAC